MIFFCVTLLNIQLFSSRCKYIGKNLLVQAFASGCRAPTPPRVTPFDLWSSAAQCATSYQTALSHGGHTIDSLKSMRPACASDSGAHSHKLLFVCKLVQV
jgi:hypothetical protein